MAHKFDEVPRFDGVRVQIDERPEGTVLIFDAIPKHPVDSVVVPPSDSTGLAPGDIERRIREEFNGVPALTRTVDVEDTVKRILQSEGYLSAEATATVVTRHDPDRSTHGNRGRGRASRHHHETSSSRALTAGSRADEGASGRHARIAVPRTRADGVAGSDSRRVARQAGTTPPSRNRSRRTVPIRPASRW